MRRQSVDGELDAALAGQVAYLKRYKRTVGSRRHGKALIAALAKALGVPEKKS